MGRCPATERREEKQRLLEESQKQQVSVFTVEGLVGLYLKRIEDRNSTDGKIIFGARRKKKGHRTLQNDIVAKLGHRIASEVTRKDIIDLVNVLLLKALKFNQETCYASFH